MPWDPGTRVQLTSHIGSGSFKPLLRAGRAPRAQAVPELPRLQALPQANAAARIQPAGKVLGSGLGMCLLLWEAPQDLSRSPE